MPMSMQTPSNPDPFAMASRFIARKYKEGARNLRDEQQKQNVYKSTTINEVQFNNVKQETPTPANTGAPVPGYRKRGPINPSTTGAPMPGTLKTYTATHPITGAKVPRVPVKPQGKKPTSPGTKPKKK
jgi:hypothetical protein